MSIPEGLKRVSTLCVLKNGRNFLLLKRFKEPNKDLYTPVGGKLEPYETPLAAAIRETWEETGLEVKQMNFCGILTETSPTPYNWICYVYLAEIDALAPPPCNEGVLEWVAFDELLSKPTPKTDWYIYDYILKGKPFILDAIYSDTLDLQILTNTLTAEILVTGSNV